jgi:ABC-type transport system involved in multi-copper enzyme maturation permease subunit
MLEQTFAIFRNTFFESIRQPIVFVLIVLATLLLIVAQLTSTFTMSDDQKMLVDVGLATVFLFGALQAAFIATNVLTREIENRTVLTVVSKPVPRPVFIVGKFFGVAAAIIMASAYMTFVFMLVEHHGSLQTVRDPLHLPVIVFGFGAGVIALGVALWCNYFYGRVFGSTFLCVATPLLGIAYLLSLLFDPYFRTTEVSFTAGFDVNLWKAVVPLIMANLVLAAFAIAISTRLSQIMTVLATIGVFLLGMLSDWLFGTLMFGHMEELWMRRARDAGMTSMETMTRVIPYTSGETIANEETVERLAEGASLADFANTHEQIVWLAGKGLHSVVPNFQVLWLVDAVTQEHVIPSTYVGRSLLYGLLLVVAALALAVALFQRREVG